jgi:hypothetical protein
MRHLLSPDEIMSRPRGSCIRFTYLPAKALLNSCFEERNIYAVRQSRKGTEQGSIRKRPAEMLDRELGCWNSQTVIRFQFVENVLETKLLKTSRTVDQHITGLSYSLEDWNVMKQSWILDDQRVRGCYWLSRSNQLLTDPAESRNRRAHSLRAKCRKRLRVLSLQKRRNGQQFGSRYDALTTAAMYADLKHPCYVPAITSPGDDRSKNGCWALVMCAYSPSSA